MKYKKKPVAIEAFQFDGDLKGSDGKYYVPEWAVKAFEEGILYFDALKAKLEKKTDMNDPRWSFDSMMLAKIMISILDEVPTAKERDKGHWIDIDLDTSICSVCKKPQEYETKYCPECGAWMVNKL